MKNLFITASLLFAFSGAFAQEKGHKNVKQVKAPTSITNPTGSEVESYKTVNGNVKPIKGSSTSSKAVTPSKTTPNRPQRAAAGTSTRAASGSRVNTMKAENVREKGKSPSAVNRAASGSRINTMKSENVREKGKSPSAVNRAASSSQTNTMKAEDVKEKGKSPSTINRSEKGNSEAKKEGERSERPGKYDADFCKGWKDGFTKAFTKVSKEGLENSDIPSCENNGKCEGYKCGYEAGMRKAEMMTRK